VQLRNARLRDQSKPAGRILQRMLGNRGLFTALFVGSVAALATHLIFVLRQKLRPAPRSASTPVREAPPNRASLPPSPKPRTGLPPGSAKLPAEAKAFDPEPGRIQSPEHTNAGILPSPAPTPFAERPAREIRSATRPTLAPAGAPAPVPPTVAARAVFPDRPPASDPRPTAAPGAEAPAPAPAQPSVPPSRLNPAATVVLIDSHDPVADGAEPFTAAAD